MAAALEGEDKDCANNQLARSSGDMEEGEVLEEGELSEEESSSKEPKQDREAPESRGGKESKGKSNDIEEFMRKKKEEFEQKVRSQLAEAVHPPPVPPASPPNTNNPPPTSPVREQAKYMDPKPLMEEDPTETMINSWMVGGKKGRESPDHDPNDEFYFGTTPGAGSEDKDYRVPPIQPQSHGDTDYRSWRGREEDESSATMEKSNEFGDKDYRSSSKPTRNTKASSSRHDRSERDRRRKRSGSEEEDGGRRSGKRSRRTPSPRRKGGVGSRWGERPTICRFFRDGFCRDGEACAFSHDAADSLRKGELCKYYQQGYCKKSNICPFLHGEFPCKAFHKGDCSKGPDCHYSHAPLSPFTRPIYEQMIRDEELAANIKIPSMPTRRKTLLPMPSFNQHPPTSIHSNNNGMSQPPPQQMHNNSNNNGSSSNRGGLMETPNQQPNYDTPPPDMNMMNPALAFMVSGQLGPPPIPPPFAPPAGMLPPFPGPPLYNPPPQQTNNNGVVAGQMMEQPPPNLQQPTPTSPPQEGGGFDINEMLRKIKGKVGEVEESPASPPPQLPTPLALPQSIPCHGLPTYRLFIVDVPNPPNQVGADLLAASLHDPKLRNDPRIKKLLDSQFNAVSDAIVKQEPLPAPPSAQPAARPDPRTSRRDPRLARQQPPAQSPDEEEKAKVSMQLQMAAMQAPSALSMPGPMMPSMPGMELLGGTGWMGEGGGPDQWWGGRFPSANGSPPQDKSRYNDIPNVKIRNKLKSDLD